MTFEGTRRPALVGVLLLAFGVTAVVTNVAGLGLAHAAQSNEVAVTMQIESGGGEPVMEMQYWLGPDRLRMDVPQGASVIWFGGSQPRMLMVQHAERRYIEWGTPQLDMMRRMMHGMKQMPQGTGTPSINAFDPSQLKFEETGQRGRIGEWDAFEVRMTGLPRDQTGELWLTNDTETGMFELMARLGDVLDALQLPMMSGGSHPQLQKYRNMAAAQGLLGGRVVRIVSHDGDDTTTITLMGIEPGPFPADTFQPPSGYQQMQMPMMRPPGNE